MSSPPRTLPGAAEPVPDPMRQLIELISSEGRVAPSSNGGDERPAGRPWGAVTPQDVEQRCSQALADFTLELIASLREVVAALDSPEMAAFFARSYAQGNSYTGPKVDMDRLRSLIAKAETLGFSR